MKLSYKMVLLFSVIILVAFFLLSSYTVSTSVEQSNAYTQSRFASMSESIAGFVEQDLGLMKLTLTELRGNTSFIAALNQYIRDDSSDQKMAAAALSAALQQMNQSPLVEQSYRVTFFNRNVSSITSWADSRTQPLDEPDLAALSPETLRQMEEVEASDQPFLLKPHNDVLDPSHSTVVYGVAQRIQYHGNTLGSISVLNEYSSLDRILDYVDAPDEVEVHILYEDGTTFYASADSRYAFPADMPEGRMQLWTDPETGVQFNVLHTHMSTADLELYIAQNNLFTLANNRSIRLQIFQRALLIMIPAIIMIILASYALTRSIQRLTKKVGQMPVEGVLKQDSITVHETLTQTVTSASDREIRELELTYNRMMLRLWESTLNELALREGTLQAQLKALQTQINPHFIYNTLNIISAKSMESGNYDVIEICDQFASMLRYSTDTRSRTATMQDEIENVRNYLLLAKARFEENLEFIIDVPQDLQAIEVPKLTLQPLVENALNHGYDGANVLRKLSVIGTIEEDTLILEIHDNGTGFSEEMLENLRQRIADIDAGMISIEESGGHIGLINTCLRLYYYSKGAMHISIRNDNGAVITLTMPVIKQRQV